MLSNILIVIGVLCLGAGAVRVIRNRKACGKGCCSCSRSCNRDISNHNP